MDSYRKLSKGQKVSKTYKNVLQTFVLENARIKRKKDVYGQLDIQNFSNR